MSPKEEMEAFLSRGCANCSSQIAPKEKVTKVTLRGERGKVDPEESKSNIEALSYVYKIPPDELIANVQSVFPIRTDDSLEQSYDIVEVFSQNFAFCGRCAELFADVYRAHRIFDQCSTLDNLISKAIPDNNSQLCDNSIRMETEDIEKTVTDDMETEIKSKLDDDEINLPLALPDEGNSNNEPINPNNLDDEKSDYLIINKNLSEEFNGGLDITEFKLEDKEEDSGPLQHPQQIILNADLNGKAETSEENTIDYVSISCNPNLAEELNWELDEMEFEGHEENTDPMEQYHRLISHTDFNDKTTFKKSTIDVATRKTKFQGPTFVCPKCDKLFPDIAGVIMHCKNDHHLTLTTKRPRADPSEIEKLKTTDRFEAYSAVIGKPPFYCSSCSAENLSFASLIQLSAHCQTEHNLLLPEVTTHNEIIKGPPFTCPKCNNSFRTRDNLKYHCAKFHQLLFPVQRVSKTGNCSCSKCNLSFKNSAGWKLHCRQKHNILFFCNLCLSGFETNKDLVSHLKTGCEANCSNSNESRRSNLSQTAGGNSTQDGTHTQPLSKSSKVMGENQAKDSQPKNIINVKQRKENAENMSRLVNPGKSPSLTTCDSTSADNDNRDTSLYKCCCSECKEYLLETEDFKQHLKTVHYEKFVLCQPGDPDDVVYPVLVPNSNSPLNCTRCGLNFDHYDLLSEHSLDIHSAYLGSYEQYFSHYSCRKCDKLFGTLPLLCSHLTECCAGGVKMIECKYCPETFEIVQKFTAHMKFQHYVPNLSLVQKPKTAKCSVCCKVFMSVRDLNYHKLLSREETSPSAVSKENPSGAKEDIAENICQPCNRRFPTKAALITHLISKHKVLNFSSGPSTCCVCRKYFVKRKNMLAHLRYVHLNRKYTKKCKKCEICQKELTASAMSRHILAVHTSDRPFKCQYCNKTFASRSELKCHRETHTTEKSYKCRRCGNSLKTRKTYNSHMLRHKQDDLAGSRPKCSECNVVFQTGSQLRTHRRLEHKKMRNGTLPVLRKESVQKYTQHSFEKKPPRKKMQHLIVSGTLKQQASFPSKA